MINWYKRTFLVIYKFLLFYLAFGRSKKLKSAVARKSYAASMQPHVLINRPDIMARKLTAYKLCVLVIVT
jgi:hypothetical protein